MQWNSVNMVRWIVMGSMLCTAFYTEAAAVVESRTRPNRTSGYSDEALLTENALSHDRSALQTLTQIEALKQEVSELRGLVEVQDHALKQLKKSQQDLYLDLDKRLNQLQQGHKSPAAAHPNQKSAPAKEKPSKTAVVVEPKVAVASAVVPSKPPLTVTEVAAPSASQKGVATAEKPAAAPKKAPSEKQAYETAYGFVRSKRYAEAVSAFQEYLTRFPRGEQAANAHYWLGEVYSVQWQTDKANKMLLDKATQAFLAVREQFPAHPKATDALLKLGLVETDKGNSEAARQYLTEVKNRYPGTSAARIADTRLQQLK